MDDEFALSSDGDIATGLDCCSLSLVDACGTAVSFAFDRPARGVKNDVLRLSFCHVFVLSSVPSYSLPELDPLARQDPLPHSSDHNGVVKVERGETRARPP